MLNTGLIFSNNPETRAVWAPSEPKKDRASVALVKEENPLSMLALTLAIACLFNFPSLSNIGGKALIACNTFSLDALPVSSITRMAAAIASSPTLNFVPNSFKSSALAAELPATLLRVYSVAHPALATLSGLSIFIVVIVAVGSAISFFLV